MCDTTVRSWEQTATSGRCLRVWVGGGVGAGWLRNCIREAFLGGCQAGGGSFFTVFKALKEGG